MNKNKLTPAPLTLITGVGESPPRIILNDEFYK